MHFGGAEAPSRVHAVVGAALSFGQSQWTYESRDHGMTVMLPDSTHSDVQFVYSGSQYGVTRRSNLLPGMIVEFGAAVPVLSRADIVMLAQCHAYRTVFPEKDITTHDSIQLGFGKESRWMLIPSLVMQIRYTFGE
jgi:hypothetical protein